MTGVKGEVTVNNRHFAYGEVDRGTQRGIKIAEVGVAKSDHEYDLRWRNQQNKPGNIHDSGVYVHHEEDFYKQLATGVARKVVTQNTWPTNNWEFTYGKEQFILTVH